MRQILYLGAVLAMAPTQPGGGISTPVQEGDCLVACFLVSMLPFM